MPSVGQLPSSARLTGAYLAFSSSWPLTSESPVSIVLATAMACRVPSEPSKSIDRFAIKGTRNKYPQFPPSY